MPENQETPDTGDSGNANPDWFNVHWSDIKHVTQISKRKRNQLSSRQNDPGDIENPRPERITATSQQSRAIPKRDQGKCRI
jgi:hypothetical protein